MPVEFRLLGAVEARRDDGEQLVLGPARPMSVLVALLMDVNNPVSLGELVWRVWGEHAPREPRSSLHSYFTRLRSALAGEAEIVRSGHGYTLRTDRHAVDVHRFHQALARAHAAETAHDAVLGFDEAIELWRGEPFAGLASPWLSEVRTALEAEHDSALLDRVDQLLTLGQHDRLVPELTARADRNPMDERLAGQLMLALYRGGQQASALVCYEKVKSHLSEELGVDPGIALRTLHEAMLREEPTLDLPQRALEWLEPRTRTPLTHGEKEQSPDYSERSEQESRAHIIPRQLPVAPRSFVGRKSEFDQMSVSLVPDNETAGSVLVIAGTGGIGKTALALHWAHQHIAHFPDGQLFVDLRGFDSLADKVTSHAVISRLLLALGIHPGLIPGDPVALVGLYRSVVADKRMLLVIDNAVDAEQVVPLLPVAERSATIVISRNRLTSVVASHNAALLTMDVLSRDDAHELLISRLGPHRAAAEPDAVEVLHSACAGLPLALTITAGRALEHPEFALSSLADELSDAKSTLDALDLGGGIGVRTALSTSCAALTSAQAEAFTVLSLAPGVDVSLEAASELFGRSYADTRGTLRVLERCSLIQQHRPGRFGMHDLVRAFARERADEQLSEKTRIEAIHRIVSFYLHTIIRFDLVAQPGRPATTLEPKPDSCRPVPIRNTQEGFRWFEPEVDNLIAAQKLAQDHSWHLAVASFAWSLTGALAETGRVDYCVTAAQAGLAAARALGDDDKIALCHRGLGRHHARLGNYQESISQGQRALEIVEKNGDVLGAALTYDSLAEIHFRAGNLELAEATAAKSWQLGQDQSLAVRARLATHYAWFLAANRKYDRANQVAEIASAFDAQVGGVYHRAIMDTLGYISRKTGKFDQAINYLQEALVGTGALTRPDTLWSLGRAYCALGRVNEGKKYLRQALADYEAQHRSERALRVRTALDELSAPPSIPCDRPTITLIGPQGCPASPAQRASPPRQASASPDQPASTSPE